MLPYLIITWRTGILLGPDEDEDPQDQSNDDGEVDGEIVLEWGVGKDVIEIDGVGLHKEAASKWCQMAGAAHGGLVSYISNLEKKPWHYFVVC